MLIVPSAHERYLFSGMRIYIRVGQRLALECVVNTNDIMIVWAEVQSDVWTSAPWTERSRHSIQTAADKSDVQRAELYKICF